MRGIENDNGTFGGPFQGNIRELWVTLETVPLWASGIRLVIRKKKGHIREAGHPHGWE